MNIILLSGGSGQRLWPLSNEVRSKQFLKIFKKEDGSHESMIQRMYRMTMDADENTSVTIATSENQTASIKAQLGDKVSMSIEPCRRDTFPAISLASAYLHDILGINKEEVVIVCPVDLYVGPEYFDMLSKLQKQAEGVGSNLVLMGIKPTYPSEKYGYIIPSSKEEISSVQTFKEKPDLLTAELYISQGALWNSGVFAYKLKYVLDISKEILGTSIYHELFNNYRNLPKISFDYAVVEKEKSIQVLHFSGDWKDLGTWNELTEAMSDELAGNVVAARCENTHVINELQIPLIALGVRNLVVAATPDGILVSDKTASNFLKDYVVEQRPMTEKRRWGEYEVLDCRGENGTNHSLTKHILVSEGCHISYQRHCHRNETWVVVEGNGEVILDDKVIAVYRGDTVVIPCGSKHAVKANTDLHIIEVQVGDELTEEDIERLEWNWTGKK